MSSKHSGSEEGHQLSRQDSVIRSGILQANFRPVNPRILLVSGQTYDISSQIFISRYLLYIFATSLYIRYLTIVFVLMRFVFAALVLLRPMLTRHCSYDHDLL